MSEPSRSEPSASLLHLLHDIHRDVGMLSFPFELEDSDHLRDLATRAATQVKSCLLYTSDAADE